MAYINGNEILFSSIINTGDYSLTDEDIEKIAEATKKQVLLYSANTEDEVATISNEVLVNFNDNLASGDFLIIRLYYDDNNSYKDYIYVLRQEAPMAIKTWHLLLIYDTGNSSGANITVEQEVNDSSNPVSASAVRNEFNAFATAYNEYIDSQNSYVLNSATAYTDSEIEKVNSQHAQAMINVVEQCTVKQEAFTDNFDIYLEDNTVYTAQEPISNLIIEYPPDDFISSLIFTLADEGDITISLPESKYIGKPPTFANGETWELSIRNGIVIGGKAE